MKHRFLKVFYIILVFTLIQCQNTSSTEEKVKKLTMLRQQKLKIELEISQIEDELEQSLAQGSNLLKVRVQKMKPQRFVHYLNLTAVVEAEEEARVTPETSGIIQTINIKIGDYVKKGDILATLNTDVLDNSIAEMKVALELSNITYNKQQMLWEQKVGSEMQYLQIKNQKESIEKKLETLQAQRKMAVVVAPFDGIINKVDQKEGELATPQHSLLYIVNLQKLKITANVPENYSAVIQRGKPIVVTFPSIPDFKVSTVVERKGSVLNFSTRTFEIEGLIPYRTDKILPNQMATIQLSDYENKNAFVLPTLGIKKDRDGYFIFVAVTKEGKTIAQKRYVKVGLTYNEMSEITAGIEENEEVIVEGFSLVSNAQEIQIVA